VTLNYRVTPNYQMDLALPIPLTETWRSHEYFNVDRQRRTSTQLKRPDRCRADSASDVQLTVDRAIITDRRLLLHPCVLMLMRHQSRETILAYETCRGYIYNSICFTLDSGIARMNEDCMTKGGGFDRFWAPPPKEKLF
jgi:hypothetical protein